jgi:dCTP deaminase
VILTGPEIGERVATGEIVLDPFDPSLVNPNSYNYRLGSVVLESQSALMDPRTNHAASWLARDIPSSGFVLQPRRFYLASTLERIGSHHYVPTLIGRSSMGRLGLFLQISADLGHLGAVHRWTLELVAVQPLRVYAGMRVGQVAFWAPNGGGPQYGGYFGVRSEPTVTPPGYNL